MPEKMQLTRTCDAPGCENNGEWCAVDVRGKQYRVILCSTHDAGLVEAARWGEKESPRVRPARRRRGVTEEYLESLHDIDKRGG